jgi:hypothetical protein
MDSSNNDDTQLTNTSLIKLETQVIQSTVTEQPKPQEFNIEDIFVNLRLISKIEVGNKLIQSDKYVNIDSSYFQFFTRWFNGVNRNDSLQFIGQVITKAFEFNDKIIDDNTEETAQILLRLNTDLKNAIGGLTNLKQTYYNDKLIQSEIDVMIDNISSKLDLNSKQLNFHKYVNKNLPKTDKPFIKK